MRLVLIEVFEFSEVLTLLEVEVFQINILHFFVYIFNFSVYILDVWSSAPNQLLDKVFRLLFLPRTRSASGVK